MSLMPDPSGEPPGPPAFGLVPINKNARAAAEHLRNKYYQYSLENTLGLWLDFSDLDKQSFTLGTTDCDIYLPQMKGSKGTSEISQIQASFHVVQETGAVLLSDLSDLGNTETIPANNGNYVTIPISKKTRSMLVARGINCRIAFGHDKWYQFELQWHSDGLYAFSKQEPYQTGPRKHRTRRYLQGERVGGGAYGTVWWVLDVTNGGIMAVKKFHQLSGKNAEFASREIGNLRRINKDTSIQHGHILEIVDVFGLHAGDEWGEIFMPLMEGNLKTLVDKIPDDELPDLAERVLRQMLLALQCLAEHKIVHRDIKPENILWEFDPEGNYHFRLGDFGLSHDPKLARTIAGTEPFMAPEVFHRQRQTTKVDIWSLFATIVWVRNPDEFRLRCPQLSAQEIHQELMEIAKWPDYEQYGMMASKDPAERPSAKALLAILDGDDIPEIEDGDNLENMFGEMSIGDQDQIPEADDVDDPEMPYYEPYHFNPWEAQSQGTNHYTPGGSPRDQRNWVAPYGDVYKRQAEGGSGDDDGTAVPDQWTMRELPTVEQVHETRKKNKGKGHR